MIMKHFRRLVRNVLRGYNHEKYWKRKMYLSSDGGILLKRVYYFLWITKVEGQNHSWMGTDLHGGSTFAGIPVLPHGISGIYIAKECRIGKDVTIWQNVTLGKSKGAAPVIGDHCVIGANAVVIGGIRIGNNVRIGAGCTVAENVPDNMTVVPPPPDFSSGFLIIMLILGERNVHKVF